MRTEDDYRQQTLLAQKVRGDISEFLLERRQTLARRDWLVLEFRTPRTRPPRREICYFLATAEGYITLFVRGEEASLPSNRQTIEAFLDEIQV